MGAVLVRGFFHALVEAETLPATIVFFNAGVKLTVDDSDVLADLRALADSGVEILVCGTCLGHYQLKERLGVGTVSNMYTIVETLLAADKVVGL